jgi:hypothetical protein
MSERKKNINTAAGPMAGYMFQPVRALYWLAKGEGGTAVGLETEDDVTVMTADGGKIREQDKSSIQEGHWPYGDKTYALWNTLCIWVRAIDSGEVDVEKTEFFLVTNKIIPNGCLVEAISTASDPIKVAECIDRLSEVGRSIKRQSSARDKADEVLGSRKGLLEKLIEHTSCERFAASIDTEEVQKIAMTLHLTEREDHDNIINSLLGWLSRTVMGLWHAGKPGWIRRASFDNQLEAIRQVHRRRRIRASSASKLHVSEKERKAHSTEIFVKQIEIICLDENILYDAVTDFVRFGKEKIRVAIEGNVTEEDWEIFDDSLLEEWKNIRGIEKTRDHRTSETMGQAIYHKTMAHKISHVGDLETQPYLIKGSYQRMANTLLLGWHPEYEKRLAKFFKRNASDETCN